MPSRAVQRKLARRETKRGKTVAPKQTVDETKVTEKMYFRPSPETPAVIEDSVPPDDPPTRKERRKKQLREALDRRIARMNAAAALVDSESNVPALRHDPKFAKGTFWKTRKDQKKRTLFLGNVPRAVCPSRTELEALIRKHCPAATIEDVSYIKGNTHGRVYHSYVVFSSVDHAEAARIALDGKLAGKDHLRVNFSNDKSQRAAAIAKREH